MTTDDSAPRLPPPTVPAPPILPPPVASAGVPPTPSPSSTRAQRPPRRATLILLVVGLVVVGTLAALVASQLVGSDADVAVPASTPPGASAPGVAGVPIATADFMFTMPSQPTVEDVEQMVLDRSIAGTAWTIDQDDRYLQVLAIDLGVPLDEATAQASFDGSIGGMARRGQGEVVSDEIITSDGVSGRRSAIAIDGGTIFVTNYALGRWVVSITGFSTGAQPPDDYVETVASFLFA